MHGKFIYEFSPYKLKKRLLPGTQGKSYVTGNSVLDFLSSLILIYSSYERLIFIELSISLDHKDK